MLGLKDKQEEGFIFFFFSSFCGRSLVFCTTFVCSKKSFSGLHVMLFKINPQILSDISLAAAALCNINVNPHLFI